MRSGYQESYEEKHVTMHLASQQVDKSKIVILGQISAYDANRHRIKAVIPIHTNDGQEYTETGWIQMSSPWVAGVKAGMQSAPVGGATTQDLTKGEQVVCYIIEQEETLTIGGAEIYNQVDIAPGADIYNVYDPTAAPLGQADPDILKGGEWLIKHGTGSLMYFQNSNQIQILSQDAPPTPYGSNPPATSATNLTLQSHSASAKQASTGTWTALAQAGQSQSAASTSNLNITSTADGAGTTSNSAVNLTSTNIVSTGATIPQNSNTNVTITSNPQVAVTGATGTISMTMNPQGLAMTNTAFLSVLGVAENGSQHNVATGQLYMQTAQAAASDTAGWNFLAGAGGGSFSNSSITTLVNGAQAPTYSVTCDAQSVGLLRNPSISLTATTSGLGSPTLLNPTITMLATVTGTPTEVVTPTITITANGNSTTTSDPSISISATGNSPSGAPSVNISASGTGANINSTVTITAQGTGSGTPSMDLTVVGSTAGVMSISSSGTCTITAPTSVVITSAIIQNIAAIVYAGILGSLQNVLLNHAATLFNSHQHTTLGGAGTLTSAPYSAYLMSQANGAVSTNFYAS